MVMLYNIFVYYTIYIYICVLHDILYTITKCYISVLYKYAS